MTPLTLHCLLPGDIDDPAHPSGGNIYDRRVLDGLAAAGWQVHEHAVPGEWPQSTEATHSTLEDLLARLPDGCLVLVDGLVASASPSVLLAHAERVRLAPLMHLPASTPEEGELLRASAAILATSAWTAGELARTHGLAEHEIEVATPGVDPAPVAVGSADGGALLCVGAVAPHKGQDVLVGALERLSGLVWTCDVVGPLDHDPSFVESLRIRAKPYAPRLRFVGPYTGASLAARYDEADLLVVPSRVETYGMVVTEALARGIPVLATTAGGLPSTLGEPVEDESLPGMLVVPGDSDALAAALRHWLTDPALRQRLRDSALARRATLADWSHTTAVVARLLSRVSDDGGATSRNDGDGDGTASRHGDGGTPTRKAGGGTPTRNAGAGTPTRKATPSMSARVWSIWGIAVASALVLAALAVPTRLEGFTAWSLLRPPIEAFALAALLLAVPGKGRRAVAIAIGVLLGLLTITKFLNIGFHTVFDRPFDPVIDWTFLPPGYEYLVRSMGQSSARLVATGAVLLAVVSPAALGWAVARVTRALSRHRDLALRTAGAGGAVCLILLAAGAPLVTGQTAGHAYDQARQVVFDLRDRDAFSAAIEADPYRYATAADLLTALRGKDVLVVFIEAYGQVALTDPVIAPSVTALLDDASQRFAAQGLLSQSALLESSTTGGASWLAHATLQSGLWVDSQLRYETLLGSSRLTLSGAFDRAGWRTVAVAPANTMDWVEGPQFYRFDQLYDSRNLGYAGAYYTMRSIPDQYTLAAFERLERGPGHAPVMAEIDLLSSHAPWRPVPSMLDWAEVGDGSTFPALAGAEDVAEDALTRDVALLKEEYRAAVEYSLTALLSYVETFADDELVVLFLGDHQPIPRVAGPAATSNVPVTVVTRDQAVLDQISDWGWTEGLRPTAAAPTWRMDALRDRFLAAFSPRP